MTRDEPFAQLHLRFTDPIQYDYEVIRPVILFAQSTNSRSQETEVPRTTVREKAKQFVIEGMLGLVDQRSTADSNREEGFPEPIARHILYLKHVYSPIHYREIVRIIDRKFGHKTDHKKVQRFLERYPIPVQLELKLTHFHEFDDAYEARWAVVRMGRAMAHNRFWRAAPHPLQVDRETAKEPAELPYNPVYCHQYWFIDIRYLVRFEGKQVYSICIIEGVSRTILAGMVSLHQDEIAILQLLHAAFGDYGVPWGIVSDNAAIFKAEAFMRVLEGLDIEPCPIESGQAWQNLIETQFNIQRWLADAAFTQAETLTEIEDAHAAFVQLFNTTRHWAHRDRIDGRLTPVAVLNGRLGRAVTPEKLRRVFRHLQFSRVVNRHGNVSIQRFYIYAERGLSRRRVTIWFYQDRLHVEYRHTLLARYHYRLQRGSNKITGIFRPKLYKTAFASPQLELLELDDDQWQKIARRPECQAACCIGCGGQAACFGFTLDELVVSLALTGEP